MVEQIIRPTGLLDPIIEVKPTKGQIDNIISNIHEQIAKRKNVNHNINDKNGKPINRLFEKMDIKVAYLHSEVVTLERLK